MRNPRDIHRELNYGETSTKSLNLNNSPRDINLGESYMKLFTVNEKFENTVNKNVPSPRMKIDSKIKCLIGVRDMKGHEGTSKRTC